jgi:hypothetical protein
LGTTWDCNFKNSAVHPGAVDICNGVDDDCNGLIDDGITSGSGLPRIVGTKSAPSTAVVSWAAVPSATGYEVVGGSLNTLRSSLGNFTTSLASCLENDGAGTSVTDSATLSADTGVWYLVRMSSGSAGCGTFDEGVASQQGSRDREIAALACPEFGCSACPPQCVGDDPSTGHCTTDSECFPLACDNSTCTPTACACDGSGQWLCTQDCNGHCQ